MCLLGRDAQGIQYLHDPTSNLWKHVVMGGNEVPVDDLFWATGNVSSVFHVLPVFYLTNLDRLGCTRYLESDGYHQTLVPRPGLPGPAGRDARLGF